MLPTFGSQIASRNFLAHSSQFVDSELANHWLATSNLLACTLVVHVTLSCVFFFSTVDYSGVDPDQIFTMFVRKIFKATETRILEIIL